MRRMILAAAVLAAAVLAMAGSAIGRAAWAAPFTGIYAFGDSLSDVGNIYAVTGGVAPAAPYSQGRFSNGNVWVQDLASALGLGPVTPSTQGGNDFAYGDAVTGSITGVAPPPSYVQNLPSQLAMFTSAVGGSAPSGALYTLSIGANDLSGILAAAAASPTFSVATAIGQAVTNEIGFLAKLEFLGARNVLLLNVPDLGLTPDARALGSMAITAASTVAAAYDQALAVGLGTLSGLDVHVINGYSLLDAAAANPAAFGLTDVTDPCWTGGYLGTAGSPQATACASPNSYLFWDGLHPTATGHQVIADAGLALVPEPASLWLLGLPLLALGLVRRRAA